ncbi:hypothetical protein SN11_23365 [Vibrio harveyi]|nr:hypothetical protein SN11_23365 [Vibrio harveyi]
MRLHIILIFFLLLEPINSLASEGISLGLNAGSDFKDMDYIGLDVGYKNDAILFSLGFNKNTGNEVDFVSGIYYDLYRNSEFSLYFGSGLEDKNAFLSYGINYKLSENIDFGLGMRTVFESRNKNSQEGFLNTRFYFNQQKTEKVIENNIDSVKEVSGLDRVFYEDKRQPISYTVRKGDWLLKITKMFDVDLKEIIILNRDIINPNRIYPGQIILISK